MMRTFYNIIYCMGFVVALCFSPFSRKLRQGLTERRGLLRRIALHCGPWDKSCLWFHVASSGELEQCLPVLDALKAKAPTIPIFVSYYSPTAKRGLELETHRRERMGTKIPWDYSDYSPFDFPFYAREYVTALRPRAFIAIHREIWPGILEQCENSGIRRYLISTSFPMHTKRNFGLKFGYSRFSFIGTTEEASTVRFRRLTRKVPVETVGDSRIDRVLWRKSLARQSRWRHHFEGKTILVLASIWKEDFKKLRWAIQGLLKIADGPRLVLVPHEPRVGFIKELIAWFEAQGQELRKWSEWLRSPNGDSHIIVDTVGDLTEIYSVASVVFVGGSFRGRVHNVLEPAAHGKPIVTGPYIENSREAMALSAQDQGLTRVYRAKELPRVFRKLLGDEVARKSHGEMLRAFIEKHSGASVRYADIILQHADEAG